MAEEIWTFEPTDSSRLGALIDDLADPGNDGFPIHVSREPATSTGRFGRNKEVDTGYSVGLFQMGAPNPGIVVQLVAPDGDGTELARAAAATPPPGWTEDPSMPGCLVCRVEPDRRSSAWLVDALVAMGAPFPTGRLRVYDPGVQPLHEHRS